MTINGHLRQIHEGGTVLEALRVFGVEVPTLCNDTRLKAYGGCRLCLVHIDGFSRLVASCTTPTSDGMVIRTHTPKIEKARKTTLSLLAQHYPKDAVDRFPNKEFHRYLKQYGVECAEEPSRKSSPIDDSHPYIQVDMSRCVNCHRCVRICEEIQGQFVWKIWEWEGKTRVATAGDTSLAQSACVACGACVDTCPSGALEDKTVLESGYPAIWTKTTCSYCGVGCGMEAGTIQDRVVSIRPSADSPVNRGHLCVKGRYAFAFMDAPDRIMSPMLRQKGEWKTVGWEEAISFTAAELLRIKQQYGPDNLGVLGSARSTNEENYIAQKFARLVLGTNNVDCCARVCHAPWGAGLKRSLGMGAATNSYDDVEKANVILVTGSNATEAHPIIGARIKQAILRGAKLIVVDPRRIELAEYADYHLALKPGMDVVVMNALAAVIVEEKLYDRNYLDSRVSEWDEFERFIGAYIPEKVSVICGIEANMLRQAARLYANGKPSVIFTGLGMSEHIQGTEKAMTLVNLALLTGNLGLPGTGVNPLFGQNNVQGSAHMGCEPGNLTGFTPLAEGRERFEAAWGAALPTTKGKNLLEMLDAAAAGSLKAMWAMGYDILFTTPNEQLLKKAFSNMELVVIQDIFLNETAKAYGTVFLPACSHFEKDGTFINGERRVQRVRKAVSRRGASKTDWEPLCLVAQAMGWRAGFSFDNEEAIWEEVRKVWKAGSGISYKRIDKQGIQWPCPSEEHPGSAIIHKDSFPMGSRASLKRIEWRPSAETTSADYPFLLTTGRTLTQFNAGTMTGRTRNRLLHSSDFLEISPGDARRLGLAQNGKARLQSRYGSVILRVQISSRVQPGLVFTTFNYPEVWVNKLVSPGRDNITSTPEYKVTAVRVEKV